jgi:hypothetical protein
LIEPETARRACREAREGVPGLAAYQSRVGKYKKPSVDGSWKRVTPHRCRNGSTKEEPAPPLPPTPVRGSAKLKPPL